MKREEFLIFLQEFNKNSEKFENNSLKSFLEALESYAVDIDGYYQNTGQDIDLNKVNWKVFYDLLMGASMYE